MQLNVGDIVTMKKKHPCGGDQWKITRTGADIKINCLTCNRTVMIERPEFEKRVKKVETAVDATP
ncbi:DUF951 domain-containing protein [Eubacteriales bacterium OttesenSCG-928-N14]|nr:DUF951 domain-containing protein [Eubacteriales bacterium OttesenSCG-928-N14]